MSIKLKGSTDGSVTLQAPADTSPTGTDKTLILPTTTGSANQFVKNSGTAGQLEYSSMVEDSSGDVGLGIAAPTWTSGGGLHLGDNHGIGFGDGGNGRPDFQLITASDGRLDLRCGFGSDDADISIDSSGRLLIGTTTEGYSSADNFTVADTGSCGITIRSGTSNLGTIAFSDATSGAGEYDGFIQYSQSSREMKLGTGQAERTIVDGDGKLTLKSSFSDSSRNVVIQIECNNQGRGKILSGNSDTDSASFGAGSDRRLKTNIRNYTGGLERIRQIPVKIYDEVNSGVTDVISWVADEVAPIFPEAVIGEADAVDAEGNPEYQILSSLKFFPDLVQCVQTLIAKVETLETQNTAQQAQIDDLLARVTALEAV